MAFTKDNRNLAYQTQLVLKIRAIFEKNVVTNNVIHVFHKYDQKVLAEKDIEEIKVFALNHGHMVTANFLLDFVIKYNNWFDCLMQVLRDPDVKQNHTATLMEKMKEELDREYNVGFAETQVTQETGSFQTARHDMMNPSTLSFAQLATDGLSPEPSLLKKNDYITPVPNPPLYHSTSGSGLQADGDPLNRSYSVFENSEGATSSSKVKVISDIPARDFTAGEVTEALKSLKGWHPDIEDKQVLSLLRKHTEKPGSYILWYWRNKRRPAICVTHDGEIKTLIVHKRPMADDTSKVDFYFINKDEEKSKSLKDLVNHHLENGVYDLTKPNKVKISFKFPLLP